MASQLPARTQKYKIYGYTYDVDTGLLEQVPEATTAWQPGN
jgi:carbonic anhydrase